MYIFQMYTRHDGWVTVPPLCTDKFKDIMKTVESCLLDNSLGFLWVVKQNDLIIATNTAHAFPAYDD